MGENVLFFITENRNREPNNRGICNRDRNFKNRNQKFNSDPGTIFTLPPCIHDNKTNRTYLPIYIFHLSLSRTLKEMK